MKLLIIDDDVQIREGIQMGIDWEAVGIRQVRTCANGADGLEISLSFQPDIILTDIRMPQMDGLEFLQKIHDICPAKVVMISGYSDFEYCQKAIRYGAQDYILKPVKVRELIQLIGRIRDSILAEHSTKEKFQEYKTAYEKDILQKILGGEIRDPNVVRGYFQEKLCSQDVKRIICSVISIERDEDNTAGCAEKLKEYINECCSSVWAMIETDRDEYLLLLESAPSEMYVIHQQGNIRRWIEDFGKNNVEERATVSAGISGEVMLSEIRDGYCQAKALLARRVYAGRGTVHAPGIWKKEKQQADKEEMWEQCGRLISVIAENKDEGSLGEALTLIQQYIEGNELTDMKEIRSVYVQFCAEVNQQLSLRGEDSMFDLVHIHDTLEQLFYTEDYKEKIITTYEDVLSNRQQEHYGRYHIIIVRALTYMEKHYADNLTTRSMGELLEITPNYFSSLFKKEVGISFREYLVDLRIKKACYMLEHTNGQIGEIAQETGFGDYMYFSQVFKKVTGRTPSEYRRSGREM